MNILEMSIKAKKKLSDKLEKLSGLNAVITHIEVAENYLSKAKDEGDTNLYTEGLYSTEQIIHLKEYLKRPIQY